MSPFRYNNYVNPKILLFLLNRRKLQINMNEILLFPNRSNLAQKVNPISVRLHLNRSSDSSWFSDHYYGNLVYQDVNLRDYSAGSIRPPTRRNPFGFRLGRCILHHSHKRTLIHLFFPRQQGVSNRGRGGSRPRKPRWWRAMEKGGSIGIKGDSTEERRGLGAGETVVRSMRLDDRSRVIWKAKQRYEYHGTLSNPAVRPSFFHHSVMHYLFRLGNPPLYYISVAGSYVKGILVARRASGIGPIRIHLRSPHNSSLLQILKEILRTYFETYRHKGRPGSVKKRILGGIGGMMRRMEMMLEIRLRRAGIPIGGYNYYANEVQKMRSLLSSRTKTNTVIGSVKIKSVYQSASPIAQDISLRLRARQSFRSIFEKLVQNIPLVMLKRVGGIRICCSGRWKGAEMARTECMEYEKSSCNAFRHRIDYASAKVSTRYGILGVKVWIPFL